MEAILRDELFDKEVTVLTASGGRFSGIVKSVEEGLLTLEWKDKKTYIAAGRIEAVWPKNEEERRSPSIGFAGRER